MLVGSLGAGIKKLGVDCLVRDTGLGGGWEVVGQVNRGEVGMVGGGERKLWD
jgi:hypothetical protein